MDNLEHILEGLLFVSGDAVEKGFIMEKLGITDKELSKAVDKLKSKYSGDCGINVITYKNKIQMSSNSKYADDISLVLNPIRERNLSKATLETVAIIAYKQPITRLEIEDIRGVNSDYALQTLMNLKMIEVVGRKDAVGKPLLFGTTDEFLKRFDLQDLNQLPDYEELLKSIKVIEQESNHLYSDYEIPDEEVNSEDNGSETSKTQDSLVVNEKDNSINLDTENSVNIDKKDRDIPNQENNKTDDTLIEKENGVLQDKDSKLKEDVDLSNSQGEKTPIVVENDTMVIDIESPNIIDDNGDDFFASLDEEIPDFLKDEKDLQKF